MKALRSAPGVAIALLLAAAVGTAGAARGETLEQAWQLAFANDQSLAAAGSDLDAAKASERAARDARWPSVAASAGYTRLNASPTLDVATPAFVFQSGPIFKDNQYIAGSVQMRLPLYAGGQISAGIDAAHNAVTGASESERAAAAVLKLDVAEAYVGVLRARRALQAAIASMASLSGHVAEVQKLVNSQSVATSDLLAARVALANAEQARVRAASAVDIAQAIYNRRLGQPLERSPELDERLPADAALAAAPFEALASRALESRGELKSVAAQADALASQSRAESGKLRPQVALTGGYTHFDNQILDRQDFSMIGVGFTWSLFDGGQSRNRANALDSASRAQKNRLEDLRSQIQLQVRQSWLGVQEAQARVKASSEAVAQADENLRISRELYATGLATNTQVLDAITLQINAVNNRDNALLDVALSSLRLAHAVGAL